MARGAVLYSTHTLYTEECWICGVEFAMPKAIADKRGETGDPFWCTNGHRLVWTVGPTPAEKERKAREKVEADLARTRARLDQEQARSASLERSRSALKGQVTRARKRAVAALCPVPGCHRELIQMKRHLASKHAGWLAEHDHGGEG